MIETPPAGPPVAEPKCAFGRPGPGGVAFPAEFPAERRRADPPGRVVPRPAAPPDGFALTFTSATPGARVARETVGAALRAWGLDGLADDAELVASELVTNALRHAGTATVAVTRRPDTVVLEVTDDDPAPPCTADPDPLGTSGRGLIIVAALAAGWGWRPVEPSGKCIWATFGTP
ncbi:ATP-binding protein [Actinomadura rayongensis]|uniref:ATP-binding protein n=1 Tax=Actinomadura rayongensis TaxID=1429076 RepID=A0A6I4WHS6_9ACTN|nr:ATP-binding protein [Actinomadura rayongensis]MXQ66534.1 ATP-binding protein [Actinomadura rayongensis]